MKDQAYNLRRKMLLTDSVPAKTIAIVSGKGGVGKSNISTNLSILLAKENKKVLLFDLDIGMGNIHILLGSHHTYSIMDYIEEKVLEIDTIICENVHGISYISGGNGLKNIVDWQEKQVQRFFEVMDYATHHYDYILFDMGAGATRETLEFLLAMDEIIVVTTPEPTSVTDAYSMMKYIYLRDGEKPFYLICNRAEFKKEGLETITRLQETVRKFLHKEIVSLGVLPEDSAVRKAVINQTPIVVGHPSSVMSLSLRAMVHHLTGTEYQGTKGTGFVKTIRKLFFGR
ncbi:MULTISPECIES: MinD/ParA family protein [Bacillaceae]|uniref:MinD/ParA family protein n=1 Tax=Bacillaceae TaxID=186817 RepID=UPI001C58F2BE|nr:MinD/ParA family protein [Rossellomorea sp. YZS02]MBW3113852.1 MinD/ParA family protein [Bacillus sp. MCCB 382]MDX8343905.1 MinD/ParA family protein [Rossellomorea sp. YZS02]